MATGVAEQQTTANRLVENHLSLVVHIAKRYARGYQGHHLLGHHILDLDDLVQEGVLGLMHAAEKFDARKGFCFSTYATYWVRYAITQAIAHQTRVIHRPISMWCGEIRCLAQAQEQLWQEHGREPSLDELAVCTGYGKQHLLLLLQTQQEPMSLEVPLPPYARADEEEEECLRDLLVAPDSTDQSEQARVTELLKRLSPRERQVIELRYQLGAEAEYGVEHIPLPCTVVGRRLGMTADLVQAVEARAFVKMRFWLERGHLFVKGGLQ